MIQVQVASRFNRLIENGWRERNVIDSSTAGDDGVLRRRG